MTLRSLPNLITFVRLSGCVPLAALFATGHYQALFFVYVTMELLDQVDGKVAKLCGLTSTTGMFFDGVADSLTHLTAFACLLSVGVMPIWMYLVLLFREVELLFHRLLGGLQGTLFGGHWPGKAKALVHAVVLGILFFSMGRGQPPPLLSARDWLLLPVIASIGSGIFYFVRYRAVWHKAFVDAS